MGDNIQVCSRDAVWEVRRKGAEQPLSTHHTQERAVIAARATARADKAVYEMLGPDGSVRERDSYTHDLDILA